MPEQIQEIPQVTQPVVQAQVESKKKSVLTVIAISLVVISLIAVGVYAGIQIGKKQVTGGLLIKVTPTQSPQPTEIPDETVYTEQGQTANWKTYRNEKYGFEFKYPTNFILKNEYDLALKNENDIYEFEVNFSSDKNGLREEIDLWVNKKEGWKKILEYRKSKIIGHLADKIDKESQIKVDGGTATRLDYSDLSAGGSSSTVVIEGSRYFYTLYSSFELVDQILATFKFLD